MWSLAVAVGSNNPDPIPSVRRVDGDSWNNERLDCIAFSFQIKAHLFEYHSRLHSNEATHVLSDDPLGFRKSNNSKHLRPEPAVICRSFSSSGLGEGLAGKAAGENKGCWNTCDRFTECLLVGLCWLDRRFPVNVSDTDGVGSNGSDVTEDFCFGPVLLEDFLAEIVIVTEYMLDVLSPPDGIGGESEPTDTREQVYVYEFFHCFSPHFTLCTEGVIGIAGLAILLA